MYKSQVTTIAMFALFCTGCILQAKSSAARLDVSWVKYEDNVHGFKLLYPTGSRITVKDTDCLRIENYKLTMPETDSPMLAENEYYLEINFSDMKESCDDYIANPEPIKAGSTSAWIGVGKDQGGDAGGMRYVLCSPRSGYTFIAVATENDSQGQGSIAKKLLRSIQFN